MVTKVHTAWPGKFAQISYQNMDSFFLVHDVRVGFVAYQTPYPVFAGDYKSDSKAAGSWSWFPTRVSSTEIMNAWSYTYTSPYIFMSLCFNKHRKNFSERTTKLRGLSPLANYTDRAAAAGRRS